MKLIGPLSIEWASQQPIIEILIAAGIGSAKEINTLVKRRALSLHFIREDHETLLFVPQTIIKSPMTKYQSMLESYRGIEMIEWIPLHPLLLLTKHQLLAGILSVKVGNEITHIALADETQGVYI